MNSEFRLPSLGSGLKEARIASWKVKAGDAVIAGAPLCEIETEKSLIEIPAPYTGVVVRLGAAAESQLRVGDVLVEIAQTGGGSDRTRPAPEASQAYTMPAPDQSRREPVARLRAMPYIRRLARQHSVDLRKVNGTGARGRIRKIDVMTASGQRALTDVGVTPKHQGARVRLSPHRKAISDHMTRSWMTIPHVFARIEADIGQLLEVRRGLAEKLESSVPLEALLIRASLPLLKAHPEFNATLEGDELVLHGHYDIGVAMDTPQGLVVPVLKGAANYDALQLIGALRVLIERVALRRASPEELRNPTFTVNNLGALGLTFATPIIPYGTTCILSIGRGIERPVWRRGQVEAALISEVILSFDHRVIDGGLAQRFLQGIQESLECPQKLLVDANGSGVRTGRIL
ncbi:MAG: dihydrolipoamide acetyltransferase family protein [Steroidobacterales bacterium]